MADEARRACAPYSNPHCAALSTGSEPWAASPSLSLHLQMAAVTSTLRGLYELRPVGSAFPARTLMGTGGINTAWVSGRFAADPSCAKWLAEPWARRRRPVRYLRTGGWVMTVQCRWCGGRLRWFGDLQAFPAIIVDERVNRHRGVCVLNGV